LAEKKLCTALLAGTKTGRPHTFAEASARWHRAAPKGKMTKQEQTLWHNNEKPWQTGIFYGHRPTITTV
jgi:hypothetical protein